MPQRYNKYKTKAILLFSIIICLFATRFIYYSTLLKHVEDKADFDFLFKEYYPQLYYYAFHLINNMEASKDIVSDAFEFIWANYAKIDKATAKSYLYVYVRNKSIDFLRHQNTHEQYVQIYSELTKSYVETEYQEQDERMIHAYQQGNGKTDSTYQAYFRRMLYSTQKISGSGRGIKY